jgi:DNA (cytosine-5)-methyltransferase 1
MKIRIGSLFSGIGGFELGLERAIPNSTTLWQVEQDKFCQSILRKHWANAKIYDDVRTITKDNVEPIDILCGGFPCQDISFLGKGKGIIRDETRSGLWWEMHRIINELRPRVAVLENVPAITVRGGQQVVGSLAQIGYDAEWIVISAEQFGSPHKRERWFCVAYPNSDRLEKESFIAKRFESKGKGVRNVPISTIDTEQDSNSNQYSTGTGYWRAAHPEPLIRRVDDGISNRLDNPRLKALGNAIVPQCSEWIGKQIWDSGILC